MYDELVAAALRVYEKAYAPYSQFPVGAALSTKSGNIFVGCNVENVSFGLTTCAEQGAIAAAVAAGEREFIALAVVANSIEPVLPCGRCRQLLAEFNPSMEIISSSISGKKGRFLLESLLPYAKQGILESRRE